MSGKPWKSILKKELQKQCREQDFEYQDSDDKAVLWAKLHPEETKLCEIEVKIFSRLHLEEAAKLKGPCTTSPALSQAKFQPVQISFANSTVPTQESAETFRHNLDIFRYF